MKFITFIIPTIGRETLRRTIDSLVSQTIDDWCAIVLFDGIEPNIVINDNRIRIIKTDKLGRIQTHKRFGNISNAGRVRNEAFKYIESKWIGFVDDDDIVYSDYVEKLKQEDGNEIDIVLFRMNADKVIPKFGLNKIKMNEVGISFAIKTDKLKQHNLSFDNCGSEDYTFVNKRSW